MMHTHQARYTQWTWIVAVILALLLLWMLLTGRGPSHACCDKAESAESSTDSVADMPFSFVGTSSAFTTQGSNTDVPWLSKVEDLKSWLAEGSDWQLEGDAKQITLTGSIDSETAKQAKTAELQALLGDGVTILNQLTVPPSSVVIPEPPEVAKLYFDTGKSGLPEQAASALEPTIEWLISHPESKAIISGYHDPRGNRESNQTLAKARAQASKDALVAAGIEESRIEMRKPVETEGTGNEEEARRVEVAIE
ncbi:MAG: OmpA family protein [Methylophilus sp.]|nr:OmpA family protein [Methylophilus sp.]